MYDPILVERPRLLRWANRTGRLLERAGWELFGLDAESLLQHGSAQAGFQFEDPHMVAGLRRLVASAREEAELSLFGRLAVRRLLERLVESRFRVERALAETPAILDEPVRDPVFIIGMPRSGTTILQALLHRDSSHRSPLCWECLLPYPAPSPDTYAKNDRIDTIRREFDQLFQLVPDFRRKHYMEADSPQECIGVTALHCTSFQFVAQCHLPGYLDWFSNEADQLANLRWHRRFLQYLQSGGVRTPRWLLKSPVHLMRLGALFEVYPDARVIMTHRHPAALVPSVASLLASTRSMYSDHEEPRRTAREQLDVWAEYFDRCLRDREAIGREDQILDLPFEDFAAAPMAVVERIYAHFGWELAATDRTRMAAFLQDERRGKHGEHEYSLEVFGLDPAELDHRYANYLEFLDNLADTPGGRIGDGHARY